MKAEKIRDMIWDKPLPPFLKAISSHEHETLHHWIGEWAAEIAEDHKAEIATLEKEWELTKGVLEATLEAREEVWDKDFARLNEELRQVKATLRNSFKGYLRDELKDGVLVQYVGVHALAWSYPEKPTAGFARWEDVEGMKDESDS